MRLNRILLKKLDCKYLHIKGRRNIKPLKICSNNDYLFAYPFMNCIEFIPKMITSFRKNNKF
jgi:hypothetical protein